MESVYATDQDYTNASTNTDVTDSGVFGTGNGKASIAAASTTGYTIIGNSASGGKFTIKKTGALVERTCTPTNKGACPSGGTW